MRITFYLSITLFAALLIQSTVFAIDKKNFIRPQDEKDLRREKLLHVERVRLYVHERLGKIKYSIMMGNLERAKVEIMKIKDLGASQKLLPTLDRYLAIIYFLEEEYDRSLNILERPYFSLVENKKKICNLKIMNMIILDKKEGLQLEWDYCKSATSAHSKTDHAWVDAMLSMRLNENSIYVTQKPFDGLLSLLYSKEHAITWLKLALYLNEPEVMYPFISKMTSNFLVDDDIRELIGLIYFRDGKFADSYNFIEDLNTPNVENIKGNLYLLQKKYELAFAQYKLALTKKKNSLNALERAIPLAWKLKLWEEGIQLSQQLSRIKKDKSMERLALEASFYLMNEDYLGAMASVKQKDSALPSRMPLELTQIMTYSSLRLKQNEDIKLYSTLSCQKFDALYCWLMYQMTIWQDFPKTIEREERVLKNPKNFLNALKRRKKDPIKEEVFIEQRDIEEMDEKQEKLSSL